MQFRERVVGTIAERVGSRLARNPQRAMQKPGSLAEAGMIEPQPREEKERLGFRVTKPEVGEGFQARLEVPFRFRDPAELEEGSPHERMAKRLVPAIPALARPIETPPQQPQGLGRIAPFEKNARSVHASLNSAPDG